MKIIEPVAVTDAQLISSTVAETDADPWDVATVYSVGDLVISVATHSVYKNEIAGAGVDPDGVATDPPTWTRTGATNRWKAFDTLISDPVSDVATIEYVLQPVSEVSGIAFFGLDADQIDIEFKLGAAVYTYQRKLVDVDDVEGWYSWLFAGVTREQEGLFLDLPWLGVGTEIKITVTGVGASIKVGQIVLGKQVTIGQTEWGAGVGILDFSRKDRDTFGNAIIVQRRFARLASFPIGVETKRVRRVQRLLEQHRASPLVWIGDDRPEHALIIYGFYRSYSHILEIDIWSRAVLEIEGLV